MHSQFYLKMRTCLYLFGKKRILVTSGITDETISSFGLSAFWGHVFHTRSAAYGVEIAGYNLNDANNTICTIHTHNVLLLQTSMNVRAIHARMELRVKIT